MSRNINHNRWVPRRGGPRTEPAVPKTWHDEPWMRTRAASPVRKVKLTPEEERALVERSRRVR